MEKNDIKTEWNLALFYEGDDPSKAIAEDLEHARQAYQEFADEYRDDESYLEDPQALKEALEKLEYLGGKTYLGKPLRYYMFRKELDANDQEAESQANILSQEYAKLGNLLTFFELKLGSISKEKQEEFLAAEELSHYRKYLKWLFKMAQYQLDESAENTLSLTSLPRHGMWVNGVEKVLNQKEVKWNGDNLPLPKALNKLSDLPTEERHELHKLCMHKLKEAREFSESEINAVVTNKKITDEMRGYETPYEATVLGYENTPEEVDALVNTVSDNFDVSQEFYNLKADILGLDKLSYADRSASIGKIDRDFDYETSVELGYEVFAEIDPEFGDIFARLATNGQIDAHPKKGKSGGAFCAGTPYLPTMLLLNHADTYNSLSTLVHEMGHAVHTEMSKSQSPIYQEYTTTTAETASTFFENIFFSRLFEKLSDKEKVIALHDKLNGKVASIFRQIAFFNFEKELHERIRAEGSLPHAEIARLMNKHMDSYMGDRIELTDNDGYFYVVVPHIRYFFYVYSYSYGNLLSSAMVDKLSDDPDYINEVKQFLSAGSVKSPQEIFADIGINTTTPEVFETGIQDVKDDIETLRELVNK